MACDSQEGFEFCQRLKECGSMASVLVVPEEHIGTIVELSLSLVLKKSG